MGFCEGVTGRDCEVCGWGICRVGQEDEGVLAVVRRVGELTGSREEGGLRRKWRLSLNQLDYFLAIEIVSPTPPKTGALAWSPAVHSCESSMWSLVRANAWMRSCDLSFIHEEGNSSGMHIELLMLVIRPRERQEEADDGGTARLSLEEYPHRSCGDSSRGDPFCDRWAASSCSSRFAQAGMGTTTGTLG